MPWWLFKKWYFILPLVVLLAVAGFMIRQQSLYPYGPSHCCITGVMLSLMTYALDHGGKYPAGESSPEASLSLLYREKYLDAYTLRGMTVPLEVTKKKLEAGELLGPDSCGWHYVEGLTMADDPSIAILWCKEALGHNGQITPEGYREVVLRNISTERIPAAKWDAFLEKQKELLAKRTERQKRGDPLYEAVIEMPDGQQLNALNQPAVLRIEDKGPSFGSSQSKKLENPKPSDFRWIEAPNGRTNSTMSLSFGDLVSDPVSVVFDGDKAIPDKLIFKMKPAN